MSQPESASAETPHSRLLNAFSQTRHDINNVLAVFMAMAELSERNPENASRLTCAVLERGPVILQKLNEFQDLLSTMADTDPSR
jgi:hypothetical protein